MAVVLWVLWNIKTVRNSGIRIHSPINIFFPMMILIYILPITVRDEWGTIYAEVFFIGFIFSIIGLILPFYSLKIKSGNIKPVIYSNKVIDSLFKLGCLGYLIFFCWKGVPLLSDNLDIARVEATAGTGFITFPSSVFLTLSCWLCFLNKLCNKDKSRRFYLYFISSILIMFSTGWRGHLIHMAIGVILIYSVFYKIKLNQILYVILLLFLMGVLAILRSQMSGKDLYSGIIQVSDLSAVEYFTSSMYYIYLRLSEHYFNFQEVIDGFNYYPFLKGGGLIMDLPGGDKSIDYLIRYNFKENDWIGGAGMPPTIFGSMYIEYGKWTVGVLSFFWSFSIVYLYKMIDFSKPIQLALYISTLIWFLKSILGQLGLSYLVYGTVHLIIIYSTLKISNRITFK
jgi:oligosaccharide repeat unit polymerase